MIQRWDMSEKSWINQGQETGTYIEICPGGGALALRPGTLGKQGRIHDLSEGVLDLSLNKKSRYMNQKIQIQEPKYAPPVKFFKIDIFFW